MPKSISSWGGTQTNETVITSMLRPHEGVLGVFSSHINTHEAGAIEHGGHKVLVVEGEEGKMTAKAVREHVDAFNADLNHEHEVAPGMVYVSHPTEYGTLYSKQELIDLRSVCDDLGLALYLDGARLGYALASDENDVTLEDIANLVDVFYIGGTKVGALFGEAVVFPKAGTIPHFYTITKLHGAMLAKGYVTGVQFDALFTDGLYEKISRNAVECAQRIRKGLIDAGYELYIDSPTNQIFPIVTSEQADQLAKSVNFDFSANLPDGRMVIRICSSWATSHEDVDALIELL